LNAINSGGAARTICNPITLTGTGTLEGSLDLTLAGDITASGNPLGNGSQIVNNLPTSNTATLSGNIFLSANSGTGNWLAVAGTGNTVITGMISNAASAGAGAGSFIAGGTGTITFLHSNSYTGGTLVGGGTLLLGARDAINNGLVNLQADGTLAEDVPGALGGSASLSIYEASAYLSQSNDYSGGTTMGYGTLTIGNVSGSEVARSTSTAAH
jgi:fibronectin-binding autotransporter adhesin